MPPKNTTELQAEGLKLKGNECFKKGYLGAAIDAYTEAIVLCPNVAVFWTNRALCHRKRNDWSRVENDCLRAIELDKSSVKARYMLGLALVELDRLPEAVRELEKALDSLRNDTRLDRTDNVDEIWRALAGAKHRQWQDEATVRRARQLELKQEMKALLKERLAQQIAQVHGKAGANGVVCMDVEEIDEASDADFKEAQVASLVAQYGERMNTLENVFDRAGAADTPGEIPDYLCCKITMDLFKDPVITPSGVTYERSVLLDHLNAGKSFDPVTRAPLSATQLVPNLALRESVQSFLSEHGWAYGL